MDFSEIFPLEPKSIFFIFCFIFINGLVGYSAHLQHRSFLRWFLLSFVITPIITTVTLAYIGKPTTAELEAQRDYNDEILDEDI